MNLQLHKPSHFIPCEINLPGSKSISNRILIIKALSGLPFSIQNLSDSDDTKHLLHALENYKDTSLINVGHAGTDMRFLTAFLSLQNSRIELTGSERLQERPIKDLVEVLIKFGADISCLKKEGYPPLIIKGKQLNGGNVEISGSVSSQFITALLLVAPYFTNGLELTIVGELVSKPYVNMTIELMKIFGASVTWNDRKITVQPKPYVYNKDKYIVESDWSAASYYYSLIALSAENCKLTLHSLFKESLQADSSCDTIYNNFGVTTEYSTNKITIAKTAVENKSDFSYDFIHCPDIAQTVACTCVGLQRSFDFAGLQTLKVKETDRILALQTELKKVGATVEVTDKTMRWDKRITSINTHPFFVSTYHDHRMAMSFAPLCLLVDELVIEDFPVVSKSYPLFWEHLKLIGINQTIL